MESNEFYELVVEKLQELAQQELGDSFGGVHQSVVYKANGVYWNACCIFQKGKEYSPNLYLDKYFLEYKNGKSLTSIVADLYALYVEGMREAEDFEGALDVKCYDDPEYVMQNAFLVLVNRDSNTVMLNESVSESYLDLAYHVRVLVKQMGDGSIASYRLRSDFCKRHGIDSSVLLVAAYKNTKKLFPCMKRSLQSLLCDFMQKGILEPKTDTELVSLLRLASTENVTMPMIVITNVSGINGAFYLFECEELREIASKYKCNLYLLPSSVHEGIVLPDEEYSADFLKEMIMQVNESAVTASDFLSNSLYYYDYELNEIKMV